jgi:hypothetical protein
MHIYSMDLQIIAELLPLEKWLGETTPVG